MELSDIARLTIKLDSEAYKSMLVCDLVSRMQQKETKPKSYKKIKSNYKKKKR